MISQADARALVAKFLEERGGSVDGGLALLEERTLVKPYGWVFFYNSRRYVETRDVMTAVAGNGPLVVLAETGELISLTSARRPEEALAAFEEERGLRTR